MVSSNRYFVCGENCSFRCFEFVAPSLVVADPDAEVDGYEVDEVQGVVFRVEPP